MKNKIELYKDKKECCGCSACYNICPVNAIKMIPDSLGFLYPHIEDERCIKCGLCVSVCSFDDNYRKKFTFNDDIKAYAVRHKNEEEVLTSRSGAMFIALANYILSQNGSIYGAGFTDDFMVKHKRAKNKCEVNEFKGSKYVQSELGDTFKLVKKDLEEGKIVLFSGTPCQTTALYSFVPMEYKKKLYLVDLVCHGVPSPYIWNDYLKYIENKYSSKIKEVSFRDKSILGWESHKESFLFENGVKVYSSIFANLFGKNIMLRESCGVCYFSNLTRPSDITIGDFWGWEKVDKSLNKDDKGISLVICNSNKGNNLFELVKENISFTKVDVNDIMQPNLKEPSKQSINRHKFESDYEKYDFDYVVNKYVKIKYKDRIKEKFMQYKLYNKIIYFLHFKTVK